MNLYPVTGLAEWLIQWEQQHSPLALCRFAYESRKSTFIRTLARLSIEPSYKSSEDAIHNIFSQVRHYIRRLGHHFRAAETLLLCASRLPELLHGFQIYSIPTAPICAMPPADSKTTLESLVVRMLPASSPNLDRYRGTLTEMDSKYQLSYRFLANYVNQKAKPCVHAEIQVLEQFHHSRLRFAADDRFVACSKRACYCYALCAVLSTPP
jgi:hypothetical protein